MISEGSRVTEAINYISKLLFYKSNKCSFGEHKTILSNTV